MELERMDIEFVEERQSFYEKYFERLLGIQF